VSTFDLIAQRLTYVYGRASFMLKFKFALEQRIEESQETILNELKSGPYELIHNPDVKEIWKRELPAYSYSGFFLALATHWIT